jgi:uroporphyrinogen-III synthase
MPEQGYNSEALLDLLLHQKEMPRHIIIVRGENGRETLAEALMKCGVLVDYENVYRRVIPTIDCNNVVQLIMQKQLHIITATSGDAIQNLVTMLPLAQHDMLKQLPLVVISERIKNIAKSLGFQWISIANQPSDDAILKAVTTIIHGK